MNFYRERTFGELISDTFNFFRQYGKNYFKNFLLLNGGVLILLMLVIGIGFGDFISSIFQQKGPEDVQFFAAYVSQGSPLFWLISLISMILFILLGMIVYSFPALYLKRVSENDVSGVSLNEMTTDLRNGLGKFLRFFLGLLFVLTPIFMIIFFFTGLLIMLIIGYILIILILPVMINIINFTLMDMYHAEEGFFAALNEAFKIQFTKFWKYIGSTIVMYIIIQAVTTILVIIPMSIFGVRTFLSANQMQSTSPSFVIMVVVLYFFTIVLSLFLYNLIAINAGLMYYDGREDLHEKVALDELDAIGKREE